MGCGVGDQPNANKVKKKKNLYGGQKKGEMEGGKRYETF